MIKAIGHLFFITAFCFYGWLGLHMVTAVFQDVAHAEGLHFNPKVHAFALPEPPPDMQKLSVAVAIQETQNCRDGTGLHRKNCHGIMCAGKPCYFSSTAESHKAFKAIWTNPKSYYKGKMPDLRLATTWVCGPRVQTGHTCHDGNDDPNQWLANVTHAYASL